VSLLVDTSVWSLAFRRDVVASEPEVAALHAAILGEQQIVSTGLVLQELLQGFNGPNAGALLIERFAALPFINPDRQDHIDAASLRNHCRQHGVQLGAINALLAQLCIRHDLLMLSTDRDFAHAAKHSPLKIWPQT